MHTERLVAARGWPPRIYSNKVEKVDLGKTWDNLSLLDYQLNQGLLQGNVKLVYCFALERGHEI